MTEPKKPLRCDKCGAVAAGDLAIVAKPGRKHYVVYRDQLGRSQRANSCGTWREQQQQETAP